MMKRMTVGDLKAILKKYNVPDDAILTSQSDEEGNRDCVAMDVFVDRIGRKETFCCGGKWNEYIVGSEIIGVDLEQDKDKVCVTIRPMY